MSFEPKTQPNVISDPISQDLVQVKGRILANYQHPKHFRQNVYFSDERHFVYIKNHKAACTTILGSLAKSFARERKETVSFETVQDVHNGRVPFLEQVWFGKDLDRAVECLVNPGYFKFTFLRDPISRTLSAYADKISRHSPIRQSLRAHMGLTPEDPKISLKDFIYALRDDASVLDFNRHWRPQVKEVSYNEIEYQYIGVVERLGEELRALQTLLFPLSRPKLFNSRTELDHRTNSKALREKLTGNEIRILEKLFEEDLYAHQKALLTPSKIEL